MILKDLTLSSPEENILYDEVLLKLADSGEGGEVLRFWESPKVFVVLGRIGKVEEDVFEEATKRDGISLLRRSSGGGTVLQGPGCFNYTLVLSKDRHVFLADLRKSYEYIFEKVIGALAALGVQAEYKPISDLVLKSSQMKFSGNAQHRGRKFILHHGTFLCGFDLALAERYLRIPREMPEYRQARPHAQFITNLSIPPSSLKDQLAREFQISTKEDIVSAQESDLLQTLLQEKPVRL